LEIKIIEAMKRNKEQKTGTIPIKKAISVLSIKLGHTDLMIGCWVNQFGTGTPYIQKRIFSTNY
jgi:hypothetical protein